METRSELIGGRRLASPGRPRILLLLALLPPGAAAQASGPVARGSDVLQAPPRAVNAPPEITADLPPGARVLVNDRLTFRVTVADPDGDAVTVRLLNPPPGLVFHPAVDAASPSLHDVTWFVPNSWGGIRRLVFEAADDVEPANTTRLVLEVSITGTGLDDFTFSGPAVLPGVMAGCHPASAQTGDVTGDGHEDLVVVASAGERDGVKGVGLVHVWVGADDLSETPQATLYVPGGLSANRMGRGILRLVDVTGDGVLDVVAVAEHASPGGVFRGGAVYVWRGGATLAGDVSPLAALGGIRRGDAVGFSHGQGVHFVDLTGDGVLDLVVGSERANRGDRVDTGEILIFAGGAALTGSPAPLARLQVPDARFEDRLGLAAGESIQIADLTGDGALDVVALAAKADREAPDVGAIYLWKGPAWSGVVAPTATFVVPGATAGDCLGEVVVASGDVPHPSDGFQLVDLTGDGVLDVLAGSWIADVGDVEDAGVFYVWRGGGGLEGVRAPTATLRSPSPRPEDRLGTRVLVRDVTGDGQADVVIAADQSDANGMLSGVIHVWEGGAGLTGAPAPRASLLAPGVGTRGRLGSRLVLEDVTGDGVLDVLAAAPGLQPGGGAVFVWKGGAALTGLPSPEATLVGVDSFNMAGAVRGLQTVDLNRDGVLDVVAATSQARASGVSQAGCLYLWYGGATLTGTVSAAATFLDSAPSAAEFLPRATGLAFLFADVTGDGALDVVAGSPFDDYLGIDRAGAVFVWSGTPAPQGIETPTASLGNPQASVQDFLGSTSGHGVQLVDLDADGVLDVLAAAPDANVAGVVDAGSAFAWFGGSGLSGPLAPSVRLQRGDPAPDDRLTAAATEGLLVADVTADGIPDVVAVAPGADVDGVKDTGALLVWKGPLTPTTTPLLLRTPDPKKRERLGE